MKTYKRAACLILTVCALLTLSSCGNRKESLNLSTAATTGALYPIGASCAAVWNDKLSNITVNSQASNGGVENLNLLQAGEVDMGFAVTSIMYQSFYGEGGFAGNANPKLRVLTGLYYNPNQVVASGESGVTTLTQLAGTRFAPGAAGSTTLEETEHHFLAAGIPYPDGINAQYVGFTEAVDLIRNRQLDGAWIMAGVPNSAVTEVITTAGGHLVPISDDVIDALIAKYPWYARYTIPAGSYEGQSEDITTTAIKLCLFASADMDDDTAYRLVRAFWENIDTIAASNGALKGLRVEDAVTDLAGLPLHDGAARYYRELGLIE